jgi:hypothetical protein
VLGVLYEGVERLGVDRLGDEYDERLGEDE